MVDGSLEVLRIWREEMKRPSLKGGTALFGCSLNRWANRGYKSIHLKSAISKGIDVVAAYHCQRARDISRFTDPRQLIKYAGLNLRENRSGMHKGKTTISKRGRRI